MPLSKFNTKDLRIIACPAFEKNIMRELTICDFDFKYINFKNQKSLILILKSKEIIDNIIKKCG